MTIDFNKIGAVILAAGRGKRLNCTDIPKVMLELNNRPIVSYIVETLEKIGLPKKNICLVVGFQKQKVIDYFGADYCYAEQKELLGTAHAAYTGMLNLPKNIDTVLVFGGDDSAFYTPQTIINFLTEHLKQNNVLSLMTTDLDEPKGLGRIIRWPSGKIEIIEKEYLTPEQEKVKEISTGSFCFNRSWFEKIFPNMPPLRKLGEYGLPTALAIARETNQKFSLKKINNQEWFGINTPNQLNKARELKKYV